MTGTLRQNLRRRKPLDDGGEGRGQRATVLFIDTLNGRWRKLFR